MTHPTQPAENNPISRPYSPRYTVATVAVIVLTGAASITREMLPDTMNPQTEIMLLFRIALLIAYLVLPYAMLVILLHGDRWSLWQIRLCVAATFTTIAIITAKHSYQHFLSDLPAIQQTNYPVLIYGLIAFITIAAASSLLWLWANAIKHAARQNSQPRNPEG